jgi:hypothetical protein
MTTPLFVSISDWVKISSISRSETYARLKTGELRARKIGTKTLIDLKAGLEWIERLPAYCQKENEERAA